MKKILIVYHVGFLGRWRKIIREQMDLVFSSGLGEASETIYVNLCGVRTTTQQHQIVEMFKVYPFFDRIKFSQNAVLTNCEISTINIVKKAASENHGAAIFYFHTKGASYGVRKLENEGIIGSKMENADQWRHVMEHFTIRNWRKCLAALYEVDACGIEWGQRQLDEPSYFAGNFWWANAEYVIRCQLKSTIRRFDAENFIGTAQPKVKNFFSSWEHLKSLGLYSEEELLKRKYPYPAEWPSTIFNYYDYYYEERFYLNYSEHSAREEVLKKTDWFDFDRTKALNILNQNRAEYLARLAEIKIKFKKHLWEEVCEEIEGLAVFMVTHHTGFFASCELEEMLLECSKLLPGITYETNFVKNSNKRNVLHVLTDGYEVGGHTRLIKHWIEQDETSIHHVIVTRGNHEPPHWLIQACQRSGGFFSILDKSKGLFFKSYQLRMIATQLADATILHHHMHDPIPILAFGVGHVPPVAILNHADHCFWLGCSVADLIIDLSRTGSELSGQRRYIEKKFIMPIPLKFEYPALSKQIIRDKYYVAQKSKVFLSIAAPHKYRSLSAYGYCDMVKMIIDSIEDAVFIIIGPENQGEWKELYNSTNQLAVPVGLQKNIDDFYAMADFYFEPFMMASHTARMDAVARAIPAFKLKNDFYPIMTDLFPELEELTYSSLEEIIALVQEYEPIAGNLVFDKAKRMKDFAFSEYKEKTGSYIQEIYRLLEKHKINTFKNNEEVLDDYDLFWALYSSIFLN